MILELQFAPVALAVAELAAEPSTREIWLFGSRANGTATEESDWDLLVFTDEDPRPVAARRLKIKIDILRVGPSGQALLEGETEGHRLEFADFSWLRVSGKCASYLDKKLNDYVELQAQDADSPRVQRRLRRKAELLWSRGPETNV
jgi:hypothetical protein